VAFLYELASKKYSYYFHSTFTKTAKMKRIINSAFIVFFLGFMSIQAQAQSTDQEVERIDYLIVVANSSNKAENEQVLQKMKEKFKDAGMHYDASQNQYYVYIEKYYSKSGADYAVWWHKKENTDLPKVWAKAVPVEATDQ
jgi:hypothetical protein